MHQYGPHLFHTNNKKVYDFLSQYTEWVEYKHKVKAQLADGRYVTLPVNKETKEIVGEENVLDIFFRPYTKKMWGKELEELDPSIINRVPIRDDDNEYYFPNDEYQALPKDGYTDLIVNMLNHENIDCYVGQRFMKWMEDGHPVAKGQEENEPFSRSGQRPKTTQQAYTFGMNKKMVDTFDSIKGKTIIDTRKKKVFDKGHIPYSFNIPA